jgi:hypothetical protein
MQCRQPSLTYFVNWNMIYIRHSQSSQFRGTVNLKSRSKVWYYCLDFTEPDTSCILLSYNNVSKWQQCERTRCCEYLDRRGMKWQQVGGNCIMRSFITCNSTPSIIRMIKSRRMRWEGHVARLREKRNSYKILVGKPEGNSPPGRPRRRWVDNIKMDLREIRCDGLDWSDMAQDRDQWRTLVNTIFNLRVPWNAGKFLSGCTIGSSSRRAQLRE